MIFDLLFRLLAFAVAITVHEFAHAWTADRLGDPTARLSGRLSLNPLKHYDPVGSTLLLVTALLPGLVAFGWAKPVPVNPLNFSDIRKGELFVSLAGVGANFALAIIGAILFHTFSNIYPNILLLHLLRFTVTINLLLGVFNMLPLPPLDGSKVLMSRLPTKWAIKYQQLERYGLLILLFLWFFPIAGVPILGLIIGLAINAINLLLNVPLRLF